MSRTNAGMSAVYDGGMAQGVTITALGQGRHRHHGSGILDTLKRGHQLLKDSKAISKIGRLAEQHGYGKRRKRGGRRKKY